jgi:GT2 family glycosyltransferase
VVQDAPIEPLISVVVASHDRPLRLRWLLNALEEQTLAREAWEVVVAHDSRGPATAELLQSHPLAADGTLRAIGFAPGPGPAEKRNAAWRAARAPLVAFTDDDCRPPPDWLERLVAAADAHPGAVVQGTTRPDPDELEIAMRAPHARTQTIDPPTPWGQTCNMLYPRELLERIGGLDPTFPLPAGEDTDLLQRALAAGAEQVAAPGALTYHCVEAGSLRESMRIAWRWQALPLVLRLHPQLRRGLPLRLFWKPQHAGLCLGVAATALARRAPLLAALAWLPWIRAALPSYGRTPRGLLRAAGELPGRLVVDAVETAGVAKGAVEHRSPLL